MLQYLSTALLKTHDLGGWGGEKLFPIVLDPRARHLSPDGPLATCHLRWGRAGPRLQTLRAAMGWTRVLERGVWRPATPRCQGAARPPPSGARCGAHTGAWELGGELWCVDDLPPHYEHLRHRSAEHRASIGRRGRLSLHSSYIKRPRSSRRARPARACVHPQRQATADSAQASNASGAGGPEWVTDTRPKERRKTPDWPEMGLRRERKEKNPLGSRGVGQRPPARVARDV